tara:strand:- start:102 stop:1031 length:930 start_codon:yes stop_codon:yes gene_type:complete
MIKKILLIKILLLSFFIPKLSIANISIDVVVGDEIITNYDIKQEAEYLKMLNPKIITLKEAKIIELSKNSLIKEIIKKNEIDKFTGKNINHDFLNDYLKDFYLRLNFKSQQEFEEYLNQNNFLNYDEIKEKMKVEVLWNDLIYTKFKNQIRINETAISKKIKELSNKKQKDYFLSEITFTKKKDLTLENLKNQIKISIKEIGFNNTANIYSESESSNFGGKVGWVSENSLSNKILSKLEMIDEGQYTDVIKLNNINLILKIEKIRIKKIELNEELEFKKLVKIETNKQLNKFSKIYFDKLKMNISINEK